MSLGQTDFNNEFSEIREQISELKNEQKRTVNEIKHDVDSNTKIMNEMFQILKKLDPSPLA